MYPINSKVVGAVESPDIDQASTAYRYNSEGNINSGSQPDELQQLKNHPLIQDFAAVKPEIYETIKATNPTLRMFIDLAKRIVKVKE
jgi:hypothetical protein